MAAPELHCSFCGKPTDDVRQLIVGPGVYICNECVQICVSYLTPHSKLRVLGVLFAPWKWSGRDIKVPPPPERASR